MNLTPVHIGVLLFALIGCACTRYARRHRSVAGDILALHAGISFGLAAGLTIELLAA